MVTQRLALRRALAQVRGCRIAHDLGLQGQEDIATFRRRVPVTDYRFYQPYVDAVLAGQSSILFQGVPLRIAQTGGTTGKPKRVPLNRALIRSYRQFNLVEYAERQDGRLRKVGDIFPQLRVAFHGGTTFDLYRQRLQHMSGSDVAHRNVYSAA